MRGEVQVLCKTEIGKFVKNYKRGIWTNKSQPFVSRRLIKKIKNGAREDRRITPLLDHLRGNLLTASSFLSFRYPLSSFRKIYHFMIKHHLSYLFKDLVEVYVLTDLKKREKDVCLLASLGVLTSINSSIEIIKNWEEEFYMLKQEVNHVRAKRIINGFEKGIRNAINGKGYENEQFIISFWDAFLRYAESDAILLYFYVKEALSDKLATLKGHMNMARG